MPQRDKPISALYRAYGRFQDVK